MLALEGADRLHLSGVTPALGPRPAAAAVAAARAAVARGVPVSFDCNYRPTLWAAGGSDAPGILRELAGYADLLFADDRALALLLGGAPTAGGEPSARFADLAGRALLELPRLQRVATTSRIERSVDHHAIGGLLANADRVLSAASREVTSIVDRIGSGDAFAAGLLDGLSASLGDSEALEFAVAAACLKHSVPGDANLLGRSAIAALLAGHGFGVRR